MIQREIFGPVITVQPFSDEAGGDRVGQRHPVRPRQLGVDPRRRPGDAGRERAALRLRVDQRPHPARLGDAARRLQAVGLRQGPQHLRARGLHRDQARDGVVILSARASNFRSAATRLGSIEGVRVEASALQAPAALAQPRVWSGRRCFACAPTSSSWPCSAPVTTRPSARSTTATTSACSPTRGRCSPARQDAEDALQDVFVRAYSGLRASDRELALRAWLFRVAHNRCIDELRRPAPPPPEVLQLVRTSVQDPIAEAERRESLRRLIADVRRLPEQQRSALLMRELGGMSYAELADVARDLDRRGEVAAGPRADRARAGGRGARHRLRRDPRGAGRCPRPRRPPQRHRPAAHARLRRLPELPARSCAASPGSSRRSRRRRAARRARQAARLLGRRRRRRHRRRRHRRRRRRRGRRRTGRVGRRGIALGAGHVATLIAAAVATAGGAVEIQHTISSRPRPVASVHVAAKHRAAPRGGSACSRPRGRVRGRSQLRRRRRPPRRPRRSVAQKARVPLLERRTRSSEQLRQSPPSATGGGAMVGTATSTPATTDSTRDRPERHDRSQRDRRRSDDRHPAPRATARRAPATQPPAPGPVGTSSGTGSDPDSGGSGSGTGSTTNTTSNGSSSSTGSGRERVRHGHEHRLQLAVPPARARPARARAPARRAAARRSRRSEPQSRSDIDVGRGRLAEIDPYLEKLDHEQVLVRRGRALGSVHVRGGPLDRPRARARRLPDVDLRRRPRRAARCAPAVARDDLQGGGGRPSARRRQGRDHGPGARPALARAPPRRAARLRRHGRGARRRVHHRRGRRHLEPRHDGDRRAHRARGRLAAQPRRLRGPEPVHRARGRVRDPRLLRAGLRNRLAARTLDLRARARPRRLTPGQALRPGGSASSCSPTSTRASGGWPNSSAARWTTPERALEADVDVLAPCALGGVLNEETVPRLRCRVIAGAANNQLADDRVADLLARARNPVGARTSSPTPAASSTSPRSWRSYDAGAGAATRARHRRHAPADLRRLPSHDRGDAADGRDGAGAPAAGRRLEAELLGARRPPAACPPRRACRGARRASRRRPAAARRARRPTRRRAARRTVRRPASSAASSRRSRSSRCAMYSSSLAAGSSTSGPWPGAISAIRAAAQPLEPVQVGPRAPPGTGR